jgi:uncharacterized membrane protein
MTIEDPGPIQMLTLAFPGNEFRGEILPELDRLKGEGIVRVIDMLIVRKDPQERLLVATASDLDFEEATALGSYFGALAGLVTGGPEGMERGSLAGAAEMADGHIFNEDDVFRITQALEPNTTAVLLLVEHRWAKELYDAVDRANGVELMNEWLRPEMVLGSAPVSNRLPAGSDAPNLEHGDPDE